MITVLAYDDKIVVETRDSVYGVIPWGYKPIHKIRGNSFTINFLSSKFKVMADIFDEAGPLRWKVHHKGYSAFNPLGRRFCEEPKRSLGYYNIKANSAT